MSCLSLGITIHADGLLVTDKRYVLVFFCCQISEQGFGVYRRLAFETSANNPSDGPEASPARDAAGPFKLFPSMDSDAVASRSYNLYSIASFGTDRETLG